MAYKSARNKNIKAQKKNVPIRRTQMKARLRVAANKPKLTKRISDARQKIMQKKRKTVVDARDILAKMAKTQDARSKLVKIRETKTNVRVIGGSILRKTDRNGKISLVTNKNKPQSPTDMNRAIQQQLGLISTPRSPKKTTLRGALSPPRKPVSNFTPAMIRKTILNDLDYAPYEDVNDLYGPPETLYKWVKPGIRTSTGALGRRPVHVTARSELLQRAGEWRQYSAASSRGHRMPNAYIDLDAMDDEEMLIPSSPQRISLQGSSRLSNVHSRLDGLPPPQQSHGILAQTKTKVVVPAGHRIVVSNLQSSVTQDDIKELFEDIGQLLVARLVRLGTAEVIYKNLKDAQKAVDTYHNRQLDGQPMKCLLVNKRPYNNPTGPPMAGSLTSEGIMSVPRKSNVSATKLVPDISTIHKVLFQRK